MGSSIITLVNRLVEAQDEVTVLNMNKETTPEEFKQAKKKRELAKEAIYNFVERLYEPG